MKFILFLYFILTACPVCFSQIKTKQFVNVVPNWDITLLSVTKNQSVSNDSVFLYAKRGKSHDSTLIMTQYFDSFGRILKREEHNLNESGVWRNTNFTYVGDLLVNKETISESFIYINNSNLHKYITTYDYDSIGNIIEEKMYSYSGDSLKDVSITIWNREYDSTGHLIKEFITLPKKESYLYFTRIYNEGILKEAKIYDFKQNWIYSYLHEYDNILKVETIYLFNSSKEIKNELFYDEKNRLVQEKNYADGRAFLDHSTQTYSYSSNGLVERQTFQDIAGKNYFYKHFYTKN